MGSLFQSFQQNKQRQQGLPLSHRPADSDVVKYTKHNSNSSSSNNEVQSESGRLSGGIRKRLSSLSLKMQMQLQPSSSAMMMMISSSSSSSSSYRWSSSWAGAFRRSKSTSSMGTADHHHQYGGGGGGGDSIIRKWWEWGWGWILSRKPTFAKDLEMNEAESAALGRQSKGSWRHIFYKVKSELGKLVGSSDNAGLPQTIRYGSSSKNFDRVPLTTTQY